MSENKTNVLETLVGDGKKFSSVEDLAKGKLQADTFITVLEGQIEVLKAEVAKAGNNTDRKKILEDLMTELQNTNNDSTKTKVGDQPSGSKDNQVAGLSHDDVVKIVEAREAEDRAKRNLATAMEPFRKVHGEKTDEALAKRASELGMSVEELQSLAKRSPLAFQSVVGTPRDNTTRSMANHSSVNTPGITDPGAGGVRNKAYYDALMKTTGALKFVQDRALQVQLHRDMTSLGDAWDA